MPLLATIIITFKHIVGENRPEANRDLTRLFYLPCRSLKMLVSQCSFMPSRNVCNFIWTNWNHLRCSSNQYHDINWFSEMMQDRMAWIERVIKTCLQSLWLNELELEMRSEWTTENVSKTSYYEILKKVWREEKCLFMSTAILKMLMNEKLIELLTLIPLFHVEKCLRYIFLKELLTIPFLRCIENLI